MNTPQQGLTDSQRVYRLLVAASLIVCAACGTDPTADADVRLDTDVSTDTADVADDT
ncbi:MAG: hypothetical protein ACJAYU_001611 [Bradymonadia bacterium]|jgi:hypothetical protein